MATMVQHRNSSDPWYSFPAIRGLQAGKEFYVTMFPLRVVPKLFVFNEDELRPELRAQRTLNRARIPELARYMVQNPESYIFSALTASIDGDVDFTSVSEHGPQSRVGVLSFSMASSILINDGQHRRAAIVEAIKERPELGDESIAVVMFVDAGLRRSQQMFADLNTHAIRPSQSIGILYDHRNPMADLARDLSNSVPLFRNRIELEKTSISNRSTRLFTLSALYQASQEFLDTWTDVGEGFSTDQEASRAMLRAYWSALAEVIPEWRKVKEGLLSPADMRADYVHAHGVVLQALGRAGGALVGSDRKGWEVRLGALSAIDWNRGNTTWEGRVMLEGRLSKTHRHVLLTTNVIKLGLGLPLQQDELEAEHGFVASSRHAMEEDGDEHDE